MTSQIGAPIMVGMTKEDAISYYGTQTQLAEVLDLKQHTISGWTTVPLVHQYYLEKITRGVLKAEPHEAELPDKKKKRNGSRVSA